MVPIPFNFYEVVPIPINYSFAVIGAVQVAIQRIRTRTEIGAIPTTLYVKESRVGMEGRMIAKNAPNEKRAL